MGRRAPGNHGGAFGEITEGLSTPSNNPNELQRISNDKAVSLFRDNAACNIRCAQRVLSQAHHPLVDVH
eukprot:2631300-Prorocentrum_lima.AAC.1